MKTWIVGLISLLVILVVFWVVLGAIEDNSFGTIDDGTSPLVAYLLVAGFIFGDAVFPVLPGETALNAAAVLAASSDLSLWLIIVAGALGAIGGDNALYWIARLSSGRLQGQIDALHGDKRVQTLLGMLGDRPGLFIVLGRYVPGVRFFVNATMGVEKMPYGTFFLWSALGGALWAAYTATLAYLVGTALDDYPLTSILASGGITTVLIVIIFWWQARRSPVDVLDDAIDIVDDFLDGEVDVTPQP